MRAITVNEYGAAPALTEVPDPHPGPGQVLIKVEAAGMNPMDRSMAAGAWKEQMPGSFPFVLGADLAGVVEAIGRGADRFKVGEEVFGQLMVAPLGSAGTYAEHVAVAEDAPLARRLEGLDPIVAAALPTAGVTALQIVESLGQLRGKPCSWWAQLAASAPSRCNSRRRRVRTSSPSLVPTHLTACATTVRGDGRLHDRLGARRCAADTSRRHRRARRRRERRRRLRRARNTRAPRRDGSNDTLPRRHGSAHVARSCRCQLPGGDVERGVGAACRHRRRRHDRRAADHRIELEDVPALNTARRGKDGHHPLNLSDIASNRMHRHRARTLLTALTTVFIRCAQVLMGGQSARAWRRDLRRCHRRRTHLGPIRGRDGMMASFLFIVSGAWLLLGGVESQARHKTFSGSRETGFVGT